MATVSRELMGGREGVEIVAVFSDTLDDAASETMWQSTSNHGAGTVVSDVTVNVNQQDRDVLDARLAAAAETKRNPPEGGD